MINQTTKQVRDFASSMFCAIGNEKVQENVKDSKLAGSLDGAQKKTPQSNISSHSVLSSIEIDEDEHVSCSKSS